MEMLESNSENIPFLRLPFAIASLLLGLVLMIGATLACANSPIAAEPLTHRHAFTDDVSGQIMLGLAGMEQITLEMDSLSKIAIVRFTVQPGAVFPWHTHPGPVLVPIVEGELVLVYAEDCIERAYPEGTALLDPGFGRIHTAFNPSTTEEAVVIAVFLGATEDGPLTLPVGTEKAASLDQRCGIDSSNRAAHDSH